VVDRASRLEVERDQQARLAATRERTRIAREMHDIVAHNLSVMIALADGASLTNAEDPAAATEAMQTVSSTGRDALNEMRRLLGILREDDAPSGLTPQPGLDQIGELADRLRQVGRDVEVAVGGTPRPLTPTEDATAYRIVQECLTNVVKHAVDATRVDVRIDWQPDALEITVVDDGAPAAASRSGGHGLDGIAERVWIYDGEMAAGPGADGGWQVRTRLPIEAS
jgi:signal transduction histidine kinase